MSAMERYSSPFINAFNDFLFPDVCCICGEVIGDFAHYGSEKIYFKSKYSRPVPSPFCQSCTQRLENNFEIQKRKIGKNFDQPSVFLFDYTDETVKRALMHIKTKECGKCRKFFAEIIKGPLKLLTYKYPSQNCCITHIPRSIQMMTKCGFDQSEQILRTYVLYNGEIAYFETMVRLKTSSVQKKLSPDNRFINIRNSLSFIPNLPDNHVFDKPTQLTVIFDDIITTGATAQETARLMSSHGIKNMCFLFIAGTKKIIERS